MSVSDLQTMANIAVIVQTLFFIVSVFFIGYQIRERNRLTRAANTQALVEVASPFLLQLAQDRNLAELWVNGAKHYDTMDEVEQFRYTQLTAWWLIHHENAFYQYRKGLLDKTIYHAWEVDLSDFVRRAQLARFWEKEHRRFFQAEFQQEIEKLIQSG
jgi:hypothetical protein